MDEYPHITALVKNLAWYFGAFAFYTILMVVFGLGVSLAFSAGFIVAALLFVWEAGRKTKDKQP